VLLPVGRQGPDQLVHHVVQTGVERPDPDPRGAVLQGQALRDSLGERGDRATRLRLQSRDQAAYAFAEVFGWRQGIDEQFSRAPAFYMVVATAMTAGVALDFANVNPVKALYWTAILNGLLAPVLLTGILLVASDRTLMQEQPSPRLGLVTVAVTTALMFGAAVAMFLV
jgi:hypothetical protein